MTSLTLISSSANNVSTKYTRIYESAVSGLAIVGAAVELSRIGDTTGLKGFVLEPSAGSLALGDSSSRKGLSHTSVHVHTTAALLCFSVVASRFEGGG